MVSRSPRRNAIVLAIGEALRLKLLAAFRATTPGVSRGERGHGQALGRMRAPCRLLQRQRLSRPVDLALGQTRPGVRWRVAVALVSAAASAVPFACGAPSSAVDGGDLLGVFDHDAGRSDASADPRDGGAHHRHRDGGAKSTPPALDVDGSVRPPIAGSCMAESGTPDPDLRRTMGRPPCRGAQILEWKDAEGSPRYACVVVPPGVETRAPLPVIVFFHAPDDDPSSVDKKTSLRRLGITTNLTADPAHAGYILLAPQGRYIKSGRRGAIFDTDYTGRDNVDVAAVDYFLDALDGRGLVDKSRVYSVGLSLGGHMAATYAMMRPDRIAAFATYAADAPPGNWSCVGPPPPGLVLYRACDSVISCTSVERWLRARDGALAETASIRLGVGNETEPNCAANAKCTEKRGGFNHNRWPKGHEAEVLQFFARHALAKER